MSISVRRLRPDDWQIWRDWLRTDRGMKAVVDTKTGAAGLVGAWLPEDRHGAVELYSMWVQPSWRGRGLGDLLVTDVLDWARECHHQRVELWVVDGNPIAERLYQRHGFRLTQEYPPHPGNPDVRERMMAHDLTM